MNGKLLLCIICLYTSSFKTSDAQIIKTINPEQTTVEQNLLDMSLEDLLNLDVCVQVASSQGDNIFTSPSTVSIISKEQIEKYNFNSIEEVLQTVAGMQIYRTYLKRNLPTSRGITQDHYANKTLVLINGVPLWNATTGEGNLDRININDIERIEVMKGPGSILYGTNAYTGAVNLVTKKEDKNMAVAYGGFGTNKSYSTGANGYIKSNALNTYISVNSSDNRGPNRDWTDERNVTNLIADHLKSENITISTQYKEHSILLNGYQQKESYYGVTPSFKAGAGVDQNLNGYCVNYTYNKTLKNRLGILGGATYDYNMRDLARDSINLTRSLINGTRLRLNLSGNYSFLNDMLRGELGADYDVIKSLNYSNYNVPSNTVNEYSNLRNKQLYEYSTFGQLQFSKDNFKVIVGTRLTNNELFGTNLSSRATIVYSINPKSSIKAIYGEAYRAPSLFEYYFFQENSTTKTVFGNTALEPEKSKSFEISFLKSFDKFMVQVLVYHGIYQNKIYRSNSDTSIVTPTGQTLGYYTTNTNKPLIYINGNDFSANGLELELQYSNPKIINAFINYNFARGNKGDSVNVYSQTKEPILVYNYKFVSEQTLSIGCSKDIMKTITLAAVYNVMSSMQGPFATIPIQQTLDLNLGVKQKIGHIKLMHVISAKNILDKNVSNSEYTRMYNEVNTIPYGTYRFIGYCLKITI